MTYTTDASLKLTIETAKEYVRVTMAGWGDIEGKHYMIVAAEEAYEDDIRFIKVSTEDIGREATCRDWEVWLSPSPHGGLPVLYGEC